MRTPSSVIPGVSVTTVDGVDLAVTHTPARAAPGLAIVLVPGFSGWSAKPGVARATRVLAEHADVFQVDLRGHGRSSGRSTMSDREVFDVDAVVGHVRGLGYERVAAVGFSMGGSAVIRHAALVGEQVHGHPLRNRVDAVVCVSTGSAWYIRETKPMKRLHLLVLTRPGRVIARAAFRVRVEPQRWTDDPLSPAEAAARLTVPLLIVHGDRDSYLGQRHARTLADAAAGPVELWLEEGFGHAEEAADPALLHRIGDALPGLIGKQVRRSVSIDD